MSDGGAGRGRPAAVGRARRGALRLALIVCMAGVVVAAALVAGVLMLSRSSGTAGTRLTHRDLRSFNAERISSEIAERGPVLFSDTTGGDRDFIVQHMGGDPLSGWSAFAARRLGQRRECFFKWREQDDETDPPDGRSARGSFVNACEPGDSVDAEGSGLAQYRVTVDVGTVTVDISGPIPGSAPMPASEPTDPPQRGPGADRSDLLERGPGQQ